MGMPPKHAADGPEQRQPVTVKDTERVPFPDQPLVIDAQGVERFQANAIVRFLLDAGPFDLNKIALMSFDEDTRAQFAQLIGYSLCGYGDLPYVSDELFDRADLQRLVARAKAKDGA